MELFENAKTVRLRSHHDKYLIAEDDEENVCQDRNGESKNAHWTVEIVKGDDFLRFKSCYGKYLTASNMPFLPRVTGRKIVQTLPKKLDSSVDWEPIRDGFQVRLRTRYGNFLRPNGGLPPWRNSVTHDIPHRNGTLEKILWDIDIVEPRGKTSNHRRSASHPMISNTRSPSSAIACPFMAKVMLSKYRSRMLKGISEECLMRSSCYTFPSTTQMG
ncbi:hypothetical protein F0562_005011 [Nyssa sinensis]|uniref:DUF569 domain-containing protein n=1 Tax=Nyssa sinensis TaxID=561372 RepID=A0A5J5AKI9_9ASTE|nr:hypothetical protein F0562_005011 [Nyssa sinensis]